MKLIKWKSGKLVGKTVSVEDDYADEMVKKDLAEYVKTQREISISSGEAFGKPTIKQ